LTCRHSRPDCATLLLDAGWPLPRVAHLLGHASVATTATFYSRVLSRRQAELTQMGDDLDRLLDRADTDAQEASAI
jgi:integrase